MMFSILVVIFISISHARTDSLLTGTYDLNSTSLVNDKRELKEIDVLRQIINQETLIRLAMVRDVKAAVDDIGSLKKSMEATETTVSSLQQTVETLKKQVDSLTQDKTLAQTVETLQRQVDTLSQGNSLQLKVEALQRQLDASSQETERITTDQHKVQEYDQMFQSLKENITEIYEDLKMVKKGLKLNTDCKDLYINGHRQSGKYPINPFGNESQLTVFCDMVTEGGGWTAIQKRSSGAVTFNRTWAEYRKGFGNPADSYWIGNDVIHQLTKGRNSSLYVTITLRNGTTLYELYPKFSINDEANDYKLLLEGPATGTLGDSMLIDNYNFNLSGMYFSTPDRDNDRYGNCAADYKGGWWFNACHRAYLNGPWYPKRWYDPWTPTVKDGTSVKGTLMMIRRH